MLEIPAAAGEAGNVVFLERPASGVNSVSYGADPGIDQLVTRSCLADAEGRMPDTCSAGNDKVRRFVAVNDTMDEGEEACPLEDSNWTCKALSVLTYGDAATEGAATVTRMGCDDDVGATGVLFDVVCE